MSRGLGTDCGSEMNGSGILAGECTPFVLMEPRGGTPGVQVSAREEEPLGCVEAQARLEGKLLLFRQVPLPSLCPEASLGAEDSVYSKHASGGRNLAFVSSSTPVGTPDACTASTHEVSFMTKIRGPIRFEAP